MEETSETPKPAEDSGGGSEAEQPQTGAEMNKDARLWSMIFHLAGLAGIVIPTVGNIVGPLIIWQIKKDDFPFVDEQGKEAVNFQISMSMGASSGLVPSHSTMMACSIG